MDVMTHKPTIILYFLSIYHNKHHMRICIIVITLTEQTIIFIESID